MSIIKSQDGMIQEDYLEEDEAYVFIAFLNAERLRHQADIENIDKTISKLRYKFPSLK